MARRRKYPVRVPYGECLLLGVAVAVVCYRYRECPEAIRGNYLKVLEKLIGGV